MTRLTTLTTLAAALIAVTALSTQANPITVTITTADGEGADTYAFGDSRFADDGVNNTTVLGDLLQFTASTAANNDGRRKPYLRFDLSSLPANAVVTSAEFRITGNFFNTNSAPGIFYGLNDGASGDETVANGGWGESTSDPNTLTWDNAPGNDTSGDGFITANLTSLGTGTLQQRANGPTTLSNASLVNFLNADTNDRVTIMLNRTDNAGGSTDIAFYPKEAAGETGFEAPSLEITYIPEPGSLSLLAVSGGVMLLRRRR